MKTTKIVKYSFVICTGLLTFCYSSEMTMSKKTEKEFIEEFKKQTLGTKEEFIKRKHYLEDLYKKREKYIKGSKPIPSNTTDPILIQVRQSRQLIKKVISDPSRHKNGTIFYKQRDFDYKGVKPNMHKKYRNPAMQMIHEQNIANYRRTQLRYNTFKHNKSIINEIDNPIKTNSRMEKVYAKMLKKPNLSILEKARFTGYKASTLFTKGQYIKAIPLYKKTINYYTKVPQGYKESLYYYIGLQMSYMKLRLNKKAFDISRKLSFFDKKKNLSKEQYCEIYKFQGIGCYGIKKYNKSIYFFKQSLHYTKNRRKKSRIYGLIAHSYLKLGNRKKYKFYINKSLKNR